TGAHYLRASPCTPCLRGETRYLSGETSVHPRSNSGDAEECNPPKLEAGRGFEAAHDFTHPAGEIDGSRVFQIRSHYLNSYRKILSGPPDGGHRGRASCKCRH